MSHDVDRSKLHPLMRARAATLDAAILAHGLPLVLFEGYRTPARQAALYAQGRVGGMGEIGKHVTKAHPWISFHQFGLAGDWVVCDGGVWEWPGYDDPMWLRFAELAVGVGLEPLAFERPHAQLALAPLGLSLADLNAGAIVPGADNRYVSNLHAEIVAWGQRPREIYGLPMPGAPPWASPPPTCERPALAVA